MDKRNASPVMLNFAADATVDDIGEALKKILDISGCPACGRLSVFIQAYEPDPLAESLSGIGSLKSVHTLGDHVALRAQQVR